MATRVDNIFSCYEFTEAEVNAGYDLSHMTELALQNMLSEVAARKINLKFDPKNPEYFVQAEAECQGEMKVLINLLQLSKEVKENRLMAARSVDNQ